MRVRTLTRAAGRLSFEPGVEIDVTDQEAKALLAAGAATLVEVATPQVQVEEEAKATAKKAKG